MKKKSFALSSAVVLALVVGFATPALADSPGLIRAICMSLLKQLGIVDSSGAYTTPTLASTLVSGNATGGKNIVISNGDALTGSGATVTASAPLLNLTQTWNNSGVTFTGAKLNVTDSASGASSFLMDLQLGGVSKFSVTKSGVVTAANTFVTPAQILFTTPSTSAIEWYGGSVYDLRILRGGAAGVLLVDDNASSFARLCLGGTTSSFPAIKRNAAAINFRLADDSADAAVTCGNLTVNNTIIGTSSQILFAPAGSATVAIANSNVLQFCSNGGMAWTNNTGNPNTTLTTVIGSPSAGVVGHFGATSSVGGAIRVDGTGSTHSETLQIDSASELLTLNTGGTTTDTSANLLPANSLILSVDTRVTTTIATATNWSVGDATTATRFSSANSTLTAGTSQVGINQANGGVAAGAGIMQTAAAKVRITTTGTPSAGVVRITVHYITLGAPGS